VVRLIEQRGRDAKVFAKLDVLPNVSQARTRADRC
jgi:hypothetical protein